MKNLKPSSVYYYEVALPLALKQNLIYSSDKLFKIGTSVLVPLKSKKKSGVIQIGRAHV